MYTLPDLAYDYAALEPAMSGEIVELHHSKHHAAYVIGANDTLDQMSDLVAGTKPALTVGLERTLAFNLSGHVLHSIFWENLSPDGGGEPEGDLAAAIDTSFGSFEHLRGLLTRATISVQGSGWGILGYEPILGRLIVQQVYDHQGNVGQGCTPLLVFDAWEHAYYLQYKNLRPDYVGQLWNLVNWADVARRYRGAVAANTSMTS
ncbi:MAG: superoxide dismutase [Pseudonocardiales bacterium]|nr:superoxide dismutase [Pseudonocardiales bacterium]